MSQYKRIQGRDTNRGAEKWDLIQSVAHTQICKQVPSLHEERIVATSTKVGGIPVYVVGGSDLTEC